MFISYDYYRTFYYVAKYKNFTQASNVLMSNQPNVTRTIKNLESELNCTLFIRSNRGVTLTAEGKKLYEYVSPAVKLLQKGEQQLKLYKNLQEGIVSIGTTETALYELLLPLIGQYRKMYPNIKVKVTNQSTPQAINAVIKELVDFAVVTMPMEKNKLLKEKKLLAFKEILVGGTDFLFLKNKILHLKDLKTYPLISLSRDTATFGFYNKLFAKKGIILEPDMEAATVNQLLLMVKENLGIGFIPEKFAINSLENGEIIKIPLKENIPQRYISLIESEEHQLSIAAQIFENMLDCKEYL